MTSATRKVRFTIAEIAECGDINELDNMVALRAFQIDSLGAAMSYEVTGHGPSDVEFTVRYDPDYAAR